VRSDRNGARVQPILGIRPAVGRLVIAAPARDHEIDIGIVDRIVFVLRGGFDLEHCAVGARSIDEMMPVGQTGLEARAVAGFEAAPRLRLVTRITSPDRT